MTDQQAATKVLEAAKAGSVAQLDSALQQHASGQAIERVCDDRGKTALHVAAQHNHAALCEHLIDTHRCDVNVQDNEGDTPLALASFAGHEAVVDSLLARGADANRHKQGAAGPLHRAALAGHAGVARKLLDSGADVHGGSGGGAPIAWAAGAGQAGVLDVLLKAGAEPNGSGQNGVTPLLMAASVGSVPSVQSLVDSGAAVDTRGPGGVTALHVAANSGSLEMVERLLKAGAAPDATDEQGRTPAKIAAAGGHRDIVAALLRRAAAKQAQQAQQGEAAAAAAGADNKEGSKEGEADVSGQVEELVAQMQREVQEAEAARAASQVPAPEEPDSEKAETERKRGNEMFAAGRYGEAAEQYTASLRHCTSVAATWANRSACYLKLGQAEEALRDARMARTLDPKYVKAWYREGAAAEQLCRWEDAAVGYYEAYMLQPENEDFALMMKRVINKGRAENKKGPLGATPQPA